MDIWEWFGDEAKRLFEEGHGQLARGLTRLPSLVCDDRHDEVDALVPELLAGVRGLSLPWIEIYVRHWHLQSRVIHRMQGEMALADCVSLMEFSHRQEHKGCPQSVCTVQDLAICYGITDGPGYATERLQVSAETLERIDPTWACFGCISGEHADALLDQGRAEEALAFIDKQVAAHVVTGRKDSVWSIAPQTRMDALVALGRFEDLLAFIAGCEKDGRDDAHEVLRYRVLRARAFAELGRIEEALAMLPRVAEVEPTPAFYLRWTTAARKLIEAGALPNDAELGRTLRRFGARLLKQGGYRFTLHMAEHAGHLALLRGSPHVARRELETMRRAADKLRAPLDALDRIARLSQAIKDAPAPEPLPEGPGALLERMAGEMPLERALWLLERGHAAWPDEPEVTGRYAHCLDLAGLQGEALEVLRGALRAGAHEGIATQLGSMLTESGDFEEAESIARGLLDAGSKVAALWIRAQAAHARGRYAECAELLDALLGEEPQRISPRRLRIDAARKMEDYRAMLQHVEALMERVPDPSLHWDRMLAATITGEWARVRSSASALGMPFEEGDEPIDVEGSLCRIRYQTAEGTVDLWARRTGPVTARVVQITAPGTPARTLDVVAFDAAPLNPPPANDEEKEGHSWLYPHVATLSEGRCVSFSVDGVYPGDDEWQRIRGAVSDMGALAQTQSGETYMLTRPGTEDERVRGLYAFVAVPPSLSAADVHARLSQETAGLVEPLVWPALAEAAGDAEAAEKHRSIAEAWQL